MKQFLLNDVPAVAVIRREQVMHIIGLKGQQNGHNNILYYKTRVLKKDI